MRELFDETFDRSPPDPRVAVRRSTVTALRKRFYTRADIAEMPDGFSLLLDGKPIRTPSRQPLVTPVLPLATDVAAEWNAQGEVIDPITMPMTRLANSVIDGVVGRVDAVIDDIAKYLETDLLCYRAGHPAELVARESRAWDPVLFWAADTFGARFILAEGIVHVPQPAEALMAARAALPTRPWPVAACHVITTLTGSALLTLALLHRMQDADQTWAAAHVDEDWNIAQYGIDAEETARRAARLVDFKAAARVLAATAQAEE